MQKSLPNFLIVGALKSGTTSLYYYLLQHPDVFLSPDVKESRFLAGLSPEKNPEIVQLVNYVASLEKYQRLFEQAKPQQAIGEVDPWCLYLYEQSIPRIKTFLKPTVRIVICLRNPVDRSYSHYYQALKQGWKTRPFTETIDAVLAGNFVTWYERSFLEAGLYYNPVKKFLEAFSSDQVLIILFEELRTDEANVFRKLCQFIDVDDTFTPTSYERANVGGIPKSRTLHKLLKRRWAVTTLLKPFLPVTWRKTVRQRLITQNLHRYPPMMADERQRLTDYYREDILQLQSIVDKDLSSWLRQQ